MLPPEPTLLSSLIMPVLSFAAQGFANGSLKAAGEAAYKALMGWLEAKSPNLITSPDTAPSGSMGEVVLAELIDQTEGPDRDELLLLVQQLADQLKSSGTPLPAAIEYRIIEAKNLRLKNWRTEKGTVARGDYLKLSGDLDFEWNGPEGKVLQ